ncbi:hypothetical protein PILCRDRAFT_824019 [Piloderma croceum F 1598]|uniref:Uncharacterized protein n=1 Tax=Piloderma croceum (strain F 1598) TaxID=765440 RepID=A0A0C3FGD9_PILCF|nr:hypothetical protein PILCRDRAFT_824019 [Piloderma croceum F 1598]
MCFHPETDPLLTFSRPRVFHRHHRAEYYKVIAARHWAPFRENENEHIALFGTLWDVIMCYNLPKSVITSLSFF